jgi:hypothetical protein
MQTNLSPRLRLGGISPPPSGCMSPYPPLVPQHQRENQYISNGSVRALAADAPAQWEGDQDGQTRLQQCNQASSSCCAYCCSKLLDHHAVSGVACPLVFDVASMVPWQYQQSVHVGFQCISHLSMQGPDILVICPCKVPRCVHIRSVRNSMPL